jgi:hypothetical protein
MAPCIEIQKTPLTPLDVKVIIFQHQAVVFDFLPSLENYIYTIQDERFNAIEEYSSFSNMYDLCSENFQKAYQSNKPIYIMNYHPVFCLFLDMLIPAMEETGKMKVFCLTFFHDDTTTSNIRSDPPKDFMEMKFAIIENMLLYPFIKKFEIPLGYKINKKYLKGIIDELA